MEDEGYTEQHGAPLGLRHGDSSGRLKRLFSSLRMKAQWCSEFCEEELPPLLCFGVVGTNNALSALLGLCSQCLCGKRSCALLLSAWPPLSHPPIRCYPCWCQGKSWHHRPCYLARVETSIELRPCTESYLGW